MTTPKSDRTADHTKTSGKDQMNQGGGKQRQMGGAKSSNSTHVSQQADDPSGHKPQQGGAGQQSQR